MLGKNPQSKESNPEPQIFEAELEANGAVKKGKAITQSEAERVMKFFTPELYMQLNSGEDKIADRAGEAWELATKAYHQHLARIRRKLPSSLQKLAKLCLHDAELLGFKQYKATETNQGIFSLKHGEGVTDLIYTLWNDIREYPAQSSWPFSRKRKHWLYDEIDLDGRASPPRFVHRILFSDGCLVEVPLSGVIVHRYALSESASAVGSRKIA